MYGGKVGNICRLRERGGREDLVLRAFDIFGPLRPYGREGDTWYTGGRAATDVNGRAD